MHCKMEQHKYSKLLNDSTIAKLVTRNLIEVNGFPNGQYSDKKNIRFKSSMLRTDINGACIAMERRITVRGSNDNEKKNK